MPDTIIIVTQYTRHEGFNIMGIFGDEVLARRCYNSTELWDDQWCTMQHMTLVGGKFEPILDCDLQVAHELREGPYEPLRDAPDSSELERLCSRIPNCTFTPA